MCIHMEFLRPSRNAQRVSHIYIYIYIYMVLARVQPYMCTYALRVCLNDSPSKLSQCTDTHTHTHTHMSIYIYMCIYTRTYMCVYIYMYIRMHMCAAAHFKMRVSGCVFTFLCMCVWVCICSLYINTRTCVHARNFQIHIHTRLYKKTQNFMCY